jgi:hypothetical protein
VKDEFRIFVFLFIAFTFIATSFFYSHSYKDDRRPASISDSQGIEGVRGDSVQIVPNEWNNETKYKER